MARILSPAIQTLLAQSTQRVCHLLSFTVGANTYRFAEDGITHVGNMYQPHLVMDDGPKYSEQLQLHPVAVKLQNITLETARMLKEEGAAIQGQEATLERLFLQAGETVVLLKGRISEIAVNEQEATLKLSGELDPTSGQVPNRKYSALCVWDFKDSRCGYADGTDLNDPATGLPFTVCPKDLISCQARGRQHRFPGFLTITRELTEAIEGNTPDADDDRALSALYE
ncbi:MAG: DUF2163 domain-containing protein [Acidobacteria bacterium]|nr:DUF2163 domain-containing protein [Acidobacteriota bacterium]